MDLELQKFGPGGAGLSQSCFDILNDMFFILVLKSPCPYGSNCCFNYERKGPQRNSN